MATHEKVTFFSDEITLQPHTASESSLIGKPISLRDFAGTFTDSEVPKALSLERIIDGPNAGEYVARRYGFNGRYYGIAEAFIQGPEVTEETP